MPPARFFLLPAFVVTLLNSVSALALPTHSGAVDFNREVRPILAQYCFKCHGMDDHSRKGELRLDLRDKALGNGKSGETAIVPGHPELSEVLKRILSQDKEEMMPPQPTDTTPPTDTTSNITSSSSNSNNNSFTNST